MESWALKKGSNINTWKKRFLVFEARSRTLGYFTSERDSKQLGAVIVTNCVGVADRLGKREHRVDIECNEGPTARTLCLAFESLELKSQWLACLVEAVESAGPTASGLRPTISFNVSAGDSADGSDEGDGEDDGDTRSQGGEQESSLRSPWKTIQRAQRTVSQWQQPAAPGWQRQSITLVRRCDACAGSRCVFEYEAEGFCYLDMLEGGGGVGGGGAPFSLGIPGCALRSQTANQKHQTMYTTTRRDATAPRCVHRPPQSYLQSAEQRAAAAVLTHDC